MKSDKQNARTMADILQDRVEALEADLAKASEILEMLVGVVTTIYGEQGKVVESGNLEVDLIPAPFTGTPYDPDAEED